MFLKIRVKLFTDLLFYLSNQEFPDTFSVMIVKETFVPNVDKL